MKKISMLAVCFAMAAAPLVMAQKWEFGGGVGGGFYTSQDISGSAGSAAAKLGMGLSGGAWLANNGNGHWGGEVRYDYQRARLAAQRQRPVGLVRCDLARVSLRCPLVHEHQRHRAFVRSSQLGAGVKMYQGNGKEVAFQTLSNVAILSKEQDLTPVVERWAPA